MSNILHPTRSCASRVRTPCNALQRCAARARTGALDWLFPAACALCDAPGTGLCAACRDAATCGIADACRCCAIPLSAASARSSCGRCLRRPPAFDRTLAATIYDAPFAQLVRGLKYGSMLAYAPLLADLLHARIIAATARSPHRIDLVLPVPLSRERMASRGFNQSIEIGRIVARRLGVPLDAMSALRVHDTAPQASLPFDARRRNVRGAFAVADARTGLLAGAHIGVVDDVMTTGATLDELARMLKRAGAAEVTNLVVARTP